MSKDQAPRGSAGLQDSAELEHNHANQNSVPSPDKEVDSGSGGTAEDGPQARRSRGKSSPATRKTKSKKGSSRFPDWITNNLKDPHSLKMLLRCWTASWVTILLLPIDRSLNTLGQAAFFTTMVTFMVPSNMPVFIWLMANFTIVLGACLGWAWGAASMAAALRARSTVLLASQVQTVQTSVASSSNPDAAYQQRIFEGAFLDTRSTAVHGAFLVTGTYFLAVLMAKVPKLKLMGVFGIIVLDVMTSYGPLFPIAQYTLSTIFLLPIGVSLGIAFGCMIFIFPQTLNYAWTRDLIKALRLQAALLDMHRAFVRGENEEEDIEGKDVKENGEKEKLDAFDAKIRGTSAALIGVGDSLSGQAGFLELDTSRGRLSGKDLKTFTTTLRSTNIRLFGLATFPHLLQNAAEGQHAQDHVLGGDGTGDKKEEWMDLKSPVHIHFSTNVLRARQKIREAEQEQQTELTTLQPIMAAAATPVLDACAEAINSMADWLERTNNSRWAMRKADSSAEAEALERVEEAARRLREEHGRFMDKERLKLIAPFEKHFKVDKDGIFQLEEESQRAFRTSSRPLFMCMVWVVSLSRLASHLAESTETFRDLATKRQHNRIWFPKGLRKIGNIIMSKRTRAGGPLNINDDPILQHRDRAEAEEEEEDEDEDETARESSAASTHADPEKGKEQEKGQKTKKNRRHRSAPVRPDPDAMPPSNPAHYLGRGIVNAYDFVMSPTGIFALRTAVLSFALWLPQVVPASANFYYQQRGLWGLIMGQLALTVYSGEQIFSFLGRTVGTIAGGIVGMVMWYISAGSGGGNPYAYAVVAGVAFVPLVFLRLYAHPLLLLPSIMMGVTSVLVYGYSWMDNHLQMRANVGVGVEVFWRRTLLVLIGFAASFAVLIVGKPSSTRSLVRQCAANLTGDILRIYSTIIEAYIEKDGQALEGEANPKRNEEINDALVKRLLPKFLDAQVQLAALSTTHIGLASIDMSPRGRWPRERYLQIARAQGRMLESLAQLAAVLLETPDGEWERKFLRNSSLLDPDLISEICLQLSLLSRALATGMPISHAFAGGLTRHLGKAFGESASSRGQLSLKTLSEHSFMEFVAGVSALHQFARACDELAAVTAALVGEVPLEGYDALIERREEELWRLHSSK